LLPGLQEAKIRSCVVQWLAGQKKLILDYLGRGKMGIGLFTDPTQGEFRV